MNQRQSSSPGPLSCAARNHDGKAVGIKAIVGLAVLLIAQPSCSPTRAALMTGKTPMRLGVLSPISKNNPAGLPLTERVLPEYFRDAGYQTFMAGKWHLGLRGRDYLPNSRGFDHFYGHVTGGIGYWDHVHGGGLDWQRNGNTLREEGYSTHLIADEAARARPRSHHLDLDACNGCGIGAHCIHGAISMQVQ